MRVPNRSVGGSLYLAKLWGHQLTTFSYDHLVGYGEAMVRLSTRVGETLERATDLSAHVGGAELNGLIAATACGMPSKWVSAVGDDVAGRRLVRHAESYGVAHHIRTIEGSRTGLYFVEMAAHPRPSSVSYDRAGSAASQLDTGMTHWGELLTPQSCFYSTGITAAISATSRASLEDAIGHAAGIGATVAFDINYRSKLWSVDEAYAWVKKILPAVDILSVSPADLVELDQPTDDLATARKDMGVDVLVVTSKQRRAGSIVATVCAVDADGTHEASGEASVVDPFGAGDAMLGSLIASMPFSGIEASVHRALNAALFAYGIHGDALGVDPTGVAGDRGILR